MSSDPLKKELGLARVYAVATGATLSSGFFLLPGLAAIGAGPALSLAYLIAGLMIVPGILSMAELATAMPRSGGIYYFVDRSLGPVAGTVAGFGTWIALILKTAFALVGVGAYLTGYIPGVDVGVLAALFAIFFGLVNSFGAKKSGTAQVILVIGLLLLLTWFTGTGITRIEWTNFDHFFGAGLDGIMATAGLVVVSYMGLTKIASVAEEVRDPERTLPLGMFLALGTALLIYVIGSAVMIGVVSVDDLIRSENLLTPVVVVAVRLVGNWGGLLMTIAAILAFSSVANAGILSASRYPMAMSRDSLVSPVFSRISGRGVPVGSVFLTTVIIIVMVTALNPTKIAKLAGAFQLLMFALSSISVIVMRESRLESYDPGYRTPLYPLIQIIGVVAPLWLIFEMGLLPVLFTFGLTIVCVLWYLFYAQKQVTRSGAIRHAFARIAETHFRGTPVSGTLHKHVQFSTDEVIMRSLVLDVCRDEGFDDVTRSASHLLASRISFGADRILADFTALGADGILVVVPGVVLAHIHVPNIIESELVLVRSKTGVRTRDQIVFGNLMTDEPLRAIIYLASPRSHPAHHLSVLSQLASRLSEDTFMDEWIAADTEENLRTLLMRDERFITLHLGDTRATTAFIGTQVSEMNLPSDIIVISIFRDGTRMIPRGGTVFFKGDHVTLLGDPRSIRSFRKLLGSSSDFS